MADREFTTNPKTMSPDPFDSLVESILACVDNGDYSELRDVKGELAVIQARLRDPAGSQGASEELTRLLTNMPERLGEAKTVIYKKALAFLTEETQRFSAIATGRPLTEEEKRIGREFLIPLTEKLYDLCGGDREVE